MQTLWHFVISLLILKIFTWSLEYVFTIQWAIHTIKGNNLKCILFFFFFRIMPLFQPGLFILYQALYSWVLALKCSALVFFLTVLKTFRIKRKNCWLIIENIQGKDKMLVTSIFSFLAPLAKGQWAIVMALCPSCICPSICPCVCKLFLQKTSQKLLTGFLPNFTGMFLRWSSFKFLQIIMFHEEFWLPWQPK